MSNSAIGSVKDRNDFAGGIKRKFPRMFVIYEKKIKLVMQNIRYSLIFRSILIVTAAAILSGCTSRRFLKELSDNLKTNIDTLGSNPPVLDGTRIYNPDIITRLYAKAGNLLSPMWDSREKISQMITAIRNAELEGLNPEDYHLTDIEVLAEKIVSSGKARADDVGKLELLLTDSFLLLSSHLSAGKIDPETVDPQWSASRRTVRQDWSYAIDSTLNSNDIAGALLKLAPRHREYNNLKKALVLYRLIDKKGGWGKFKTSLPKLEEGMRHPDVVQLRNRLAITQGNIQFNPLDEDLFDFDLYKQVVLFQQMNGLEPDGVAGKATLEALNIPVKERIAAIEANLERWRWISDNLGRRYIRVNIAAFDLRFIENDSLILDSPAIVGRSYKQTPVFSAAVKYLVLNPSWTIPPDIVNDEVLPEVIKNPSYLAKHDMVIVRDDGSLINPSSIVWNNFSEKGFPYMIRQNPGPENPLGSIKFDFPNGYDVYIHDTPSRSLFLQTSRTFSHGCIRISKAFDLAEYLLKNLPGWDSVSLQKAINTGTTMIITLPDPVPVHILYLTAWADDDGNACFTKDVYDLDERLIDALKQVPPGFYREVHLSDINPEKGLGKPAFSLKNR
ncbi:MAG: L,D-transpeptidase family protein [Bacteroidales bacterium]